MVRFHLILFLFLLKISLGLQLHMQMYQNLHILKDTHNSKTIQGNKAACHIHISLQGMFLESAVFEIPFILYIFFSGSGKNLFLGEFFNASKKFQNISISLKILATTIYILLVPILTRHTSHFYVALQHKLLL